MSIRRRITVTFTLVVALLFAVFSVFVYGSYSGYRRTLFTSRLERRAEATQTFLTDRATFRGTIIITLYAQYEAIFDPADNIVYSSSVRNDYVPTAQFLDQVRRTGRSVFAYNTTAWPSAKEGVARAFQYGGKPYVAIVTAYDLYGRQTGQTLALSLIVGNVLTLLVIVLTGFWLSKRAMRPFDALIAQIDYAPVDDFRFRLRSSHSRGTGRPDEAGLIAQSFNTLLDRLNELARSQRQFINYASHELRTPLTVVKGQLQTALAYDDTVAALKTSVQTALTRLDSAIELANALLRLAEVEGLNPATFENDVNSVDLFMDTVETLHYTYPQQVLNVAILPAFEANSVHLRLRGVAQLLQTAVGNVADNACKYANSQPVELTLDYVPNQLEIRVRDHGIGIPADDLGSVFIPLMRAGNVGDVRGFGLGLTLAHRIVTLHGGTLRIQSVVGQGTTVRIRLPVETD